ncbi:hypothetical protein L3Y34_006275 [Caenorhabditis briggsae]|uniref:C-type lectin domain-containing protein n=2 Tax=Caenorhabditis briggsae TaxID=6238 RepID=A0AAE9CYP8_CAEBR|nr:hypothetical protein L3Y34_006275 [Caenorhabditis briggsae]
MYKLLFLFQIFPFCWSINSTSKYQMILVRGNLGSTNNCTSYSETNFNFINCTVMCARSELCSVTQFQNDTCFLCGIPARSSLEISNDKSFIGVPVVNETSDLESMCDSLRNTLTSTTRTTKSLITTILPKSCPPGNWKMFLRGSDYWCLGVITSFAPTRKNYTAAVNLCSSQNIKIAGLNSVEEQVFVRDFGNVIRASQLLPELRVWVDGMRKPKCVSSDWQFVPGCDYSNAFDFTDTSLVSRDGYTWMDGEPNGMLDNNVIQSCIHMIATTGYRSGSADDISCNFSTPKILAVVCGQKAT